MCEIETLSIPGPDLGLQYLRLRLQFGNIMVIKLSLSYVAPGQACNPVNYIFQVNYYEKKYKFHIPIKTSTTFLAAATPCRGRAT